MKPLYSLTMLMALSAVVGPTLAAPKTPVAAELLSSKDAVALVGGPLEEVSKYESKPTAENGHDHNTVCGYFPKGYRLAGASRPPERGIQLSLHRFPSHAEAKKFYDLTAEAEGEMAKDATLGSKVTSLKGAGEAGVVSIKKLAPEPKAVYQVAIATFLKGSVMGQVTAWKRDATASDAASNGAKQIAARLP